MKNQVMNTQLELTSMPFGQNYTSLLELQGECKIEFIQPIRISWVKTIVLIIPIVVSVVGLLLLKYFKWFRVKVFWEDAEYGEASAVYIRGSGGIQEIEYLQKDDDKGTYFHFKKLKYEMKKGDKAVPAGFQYEKEFETYFKKSYFQNGVSDRSLLEKQKYYGLNEHKVQTPWYFQYIFQVMTKPFFLLQYIICIIFILQKLQIFAIIMLLFSLLTTSINYVLLWFSFKKIKEIAERIIKVKVIRNGSISQIDSVHLVPGDIFIPDGELVCDGVLVKGEVYVNESSLTGESVPIGKFSVNNEQSLKETNRWILEGSHVLQSRGDARGMVVNIGYATRRGRIIRKILTRVAKAPDFFITAIYFLIQAFIVATILYLATLPVIFGIKITSLFIGYRFLDFLGWTFPPTFPIFFNLAYSFALGRLRSKNIVGTQPEKTVDSAKLKIMCFDKTGTLTQNQIEVFQIIKFFSEEKHEDITKQRDNPENDFIWKLFATCHTVKEINGQFLGDEVDLRMFLFSEYKMSLVQDQKIKFVVEGKKGQKLEVLRINQFQSKFQSMSVLVKDCISSKYYGFLKGAPEKIDKNSILRVTDYEKLVSGLSLGGYRTIGYGYREIPEAEVQQYLEQSREIFEKQIIAMGLIGFQNKLKHDTNQTILSLVSAGIQPKMITGDNIYIAVETGIRAGIIERESPVILIEGRKQNFEKDQERVFKGILVSRKNNQTIQQPITLNQKGDYLTHQYPIAVDNDFLTLKPEPYLSNRIKLFSRISPQNKALVVRRFKQQVELEYRSRSFTKRFFGEMKQKVGMTGDGANDLMAIREADVGLGISDSDASYGASFAIVNMMDIEEIIRESKCTEQNIIEMFQYYGTISFLKIPAAILLISDVTYFNAAELTYFNFTSTVIFPLLFAISRPSKQMNKDSPCSNFMGLSNHLIYWGHTIIPTAALISGYYYYRDSGYWAPNSVRQVTNDGYSKIPNGTNTIIWLMIQIPFVFNALLIYNSKPFKERIWKNILLSILIGANVIVNVGFFFFSGFTIKLIGVLKVQTAPAFIVLAIVFAFVIIGLVFSEFVNQLELHKKKTQPSQSIGITNE